MDFATQQKQFDDVKWYDSIVAGCDLCGSYEFCDACDKALDHPCARAMAKKQGEAACADASSAQKAATSVQEEIACSQDVAGKEVASKPFTKIATLRIKFR